MKKKFLLIMTFLFILIPTTNVFAYSLFSGKFPTRNINYVISSNVPDGYVNSVQDAANMWYNNSSINLTRGNSGAITVQAGYYGNTGWDGQSSMNPSWSSSTYTSGYSTLNRSYMDGYSALRRQLVICHELGHELSLKHVNSYVMMYENDVWTAYLNNSSLSDKPAQDDINGVNKKYN